MCHRSNYPFFAHLRHRRERQGGPLDEASSSPKCHCQQKCHSPSALRHMKTHSLGLHNAIRFGTNQEHWHQHYSRHRPESPASYSLANWSDSFTRSWLRLGRQSTSVLALHHVWRPQNSVQTHRHKGPIVPVRVDLLFADAPLPFSTAQPPHVCHGAPTSCKTPVTSPISNRLSI